MKSEKKKERKKARQQRYIRIESKYDPSERRKKRKTETKRSGNIAYALLRAYGLIGLIPVVIKAPDKH